MDDSAVIAAQIGRAPGAGGEVVVRCHLGLPVVVRMPPLLDDGTPFPTRFWLSCPLAVRRIDRLEGAGGVRAAARRAEAVPEFRSRLEAAHQRYEAERDADLLADWSPLPSGGVGGTKRGGVKCLHAHYADHAAGNDNPVGEMVAPWVEPLDCENECVVSGEGDVVKNPEWREPK